MICCRMPSWKRLPRACGTGRRPIRTSVSTSAPTGYPAAHAARSARRAGRGRGRSAHPPLLPPPPSRQPRRAHALRRIGARPARGDARFRRRHADRAVRLRRSLAGGAVTAYEVDAISPDETAFHIPAVHALPVADGAIRYGDDLQFVPDQYMDDPEETKAGLRRPSPAWPTSSTSTCSCSPTARRSRAAAARPCAASRLLASLTASKRANATRVLTPAGRGHVSLGLDVSRRRPTPKSGFDFIGTDEVERRSGVVARARNHPLHR